MVMSKLKRMMGPRGLVLGTLVALGTWEMGALAVGPDNSPELVQVAAQANPDRAPKAEPEKRVKFEMRNTPWDKVLEFLADNSGLPINAPNKPTGTYNFITPKDR